MKLGNSSQMDGKKIAEIHFFEDVESFLKPKDGQKLICRNEFHGEYDLDWAILFDEKGNEISRWNIKMLLGIVWKE